MNFVVGDLGFPEFKHSTAGVPLLHVAQTSVRGALGAKEAKCGLPGPGFAQGLAPWFAQSLRVTVPRDPDGEKPLGPRVFPPLLPREQYLPGV